MVHFYCVDRLGSTGDVHLIHKTEAGCSFMPAPENCIDLGECITPHAALIAAAKHFRRVNGCYYCASICHVPPTPADRPSPSPPP